MKGLKMLLVVVVSMTFGILLVNSNFYGKTYAQQSSSMGFKIGVVNLQNCFDKYDGAQVYQEDMKRSLDKSKNEIVDLDKKLNDLKAQFQGAPVGKLKESKLREYLETKAKLEILTKLSESQFLSLRESYMAQIYNEAREAVRKVADEQGLTVVFKIEDPLDAIESKIEVAQNINYRTVLYASNVIDVTDAVLNKMNAEYKKRK